MGCSDHFGPQAEFSDWNTVEVKFPVSLDVPSWWQGAQLQQCKTLIFQDTSGGEEKSNMPFVDLTKHTH